MPLSDPLLDEVTKTLDAAKEGSIPQVVWEDLVRKLADRIWPRD